MKQPPLDISAPLAPGIAVWPEDPPFRLDRLADLGVGDGCTLSMISMSAHTGTHVDAPSHYIPGGGDAAALALSAMIGPAWVADVSASAGRIDAAALRARVPPVGAERLLLKTGARAPVAAQPFDPDFAAVTPDGARWLVDLGIQLVGIDTPSIAPYGALEETHRILLAAGIVIVEGLVLEHAPPGPRFLVCLPLRLVGAEGAPARAVLLETSALSPGAAAQVAR